jgi:tRNA-dihydrouridine synthase B
MNRAAFSPPLFLAPMAGITHSAFRRLVADYGGYGALYTEMLSGSALMAEDLLHSPYTKKRESEGAVIYQLLLSGEENIEAIVNRLATLAPAAIDLNLGCPAPDLRKMSAGAMLFEDLPRLKSVLGRLRACWQGPLFVKCRLGKERDGWQEAFAARLRAFESAGVDAIAVHPRFFHEKLKRTARHGLFARIASQTVLPLIANGDIGSLGAIERHADAFAGSRGIMIGRMAVVKPWIFREWAGESVAVDYAEVWERLYRYVCEDFAAEKALGRLKEFTAYYSRNFFFGHSLFVAVQNAKTVEQAHEKAMEFLSKGPQLVAEPMVAGV